MAPVVTLYSGTGSPNGLKTAVLLEEIKAAYPDFEYDVRAIDMTKDEQKSDWFLKINPNGRVPAIVHHRAMSDFTVFESAAILLYLTQRFDAEKKFSFEPKSEFESDALQWIFFVHGGVGPMQGQASHFLKYAPETIPYGINRYIAETKRLYGVLNTRLKDREYFAGPGKGTFSIADINVWPWVRAHGQVGMSNLDAFPYLKAWNARVSARPAVQSALNIPPSPPPAKTTEEQEARDKAEKEWVMRSNNEVQV